jgi:hypothetical protein
MRSALLRLQSAAGIDRSISTTVVMRVISALAGLVTLGMVGTRLSKPEQGYYYTFNNVLALQVFFELGLSFVILQSASHERARLSWGPDSLLFGDPQAKSRLASLLKLSMRWYTAIGVLLVACVLPVGIVFFTMRGEADGVAWRTPWIALVLSTSLYVVLGAIFSFLEGCGLVAEIATARLVQTIAGSVALWSVLLAGAGLYAAAANITLFVLSGLGWLAFKHRAALADLWRTDAGAERVDWRKDIWPFQWRIAVSWLCGFFISQLFTPVLFWFSGATEAGRMGMILAITGPISGMAMAWVTTKAPRFGHLVAREEYGELDSLYDAALRQMLAVVGVGAVCLVSGVVFLNWIGHPLASRLLPPGPTAFMAASMIANTVVFAQAAYLRAHKREPFLGLSVLVALLMTVGTLTLGRLYGALGVTAGYFVVSLIGLAVGTAIFRARRSEWHASREAA